MIICWLKPRRTLKDSLLLRQQQFHAQLRQQKSPLLTMPGELRNEIYRHVLLDTGRTSAVQYDSTGFTRPALLNACKMIRFEALKMFYLENKFETTVNKYNPSTMLRWYTHFDRLNIDAVEDCTVDDTQPSWANLVEWLRLYHACLVMNAPKCPDILCGLFRMSTTREIIIGGMVSTVEIMRKEPWKKVHKVLALWRAAFARQDDRWTADGS
ncbi:hypothetical protein DOTSEDRAFT_181859 [Dothistroma septosporum NZE10]|uniref:Uncharacterized protein n=1 Tax=Dothistroma septosporum (strain NZE10 / CBS 128990) TaxID=675120 RepID=N1PDS8_DOTSN|nr:hypothetical protein DOTSEDRAFT_181859 [Dothistroma septosporum NZE10]